MTIKNVSRIGITPVNGMVFQVLDNNPPGKQKIFPGIAIGFMFIRTWFLYSLEKCGFSYKAGDDRNSIASERQSLRPRLVIMCNLQINLFISISGNT